ncbi:MAG TPA: class I SAM-dependent methyltransferase [Thermoanaerobaculia bacterium]|nr:class I SAM-dependent methyltransferase [Thermoanaerobaculia bacterium]
MTWYLEWFGEEYLDLYSYRDEEEARRQVAFFRAKVGEVPGMVLDLACGSGRHVRELEAQGYSVAGCDLSLTILRAGLREYGPMNLARSDMRQLPFREGNFSALVNFFTSFGYFTEQEENLMVVREMSRVLRVGAPYLFDYLNMQREIENLVPDEQRLSESGPVHIQRWFDPVSRTFNKRIAIESKRFIERVRAYDLDEIKTMFASCQFSIDQVYGDFDGQPLDSTSPRLIVVGTRL